MRSNRPRCAACVSARETISRRMMAPNWWSRRWRTGGALLVYRRGPRGHRGGAFGHDQFQQAGGPAARRAGGRYRHIRSARRGAAAPLPQSGSRRSRGFVGGRVDLIAHQMSIAGEVAARLVPRVLLADEVGLGKTIEAGLILHRLHLTGRAERILILVPEPLVHQWFVEMLRRFNLLFSIFDEERCASIEQHDPARIRFSTASSSFAARGFSSGMTRARAGARRGLGSARRGRGASSRMEPGAPRARIRAGRGAGEADSRDCCCSRRRRSSLVPRGISPACACSIPIATRIWNVSSRRRSTTRRSRKPSIA